MSGVTVPLGFPYPTDADLVQGVDEAIQALAEAVDDSIAGADGVVTYAGVGVAAIEGSIVSRRGRLATLRMGISFSGAVAANVTVANVPAGFRPPSVYRCVCWNTAGTAVGVLTVNTNGTVQTAQAFASGVTLLGSVTFPVA
jgi:hypothetical protein